jgi:5-deoxy-glucuronate isomerase
VTTWHKPWPTLAVSAEGDYGVDAQDGTQGEVVRLTPEEAGWAYCGLRIIHLPPGVETVVATGPSETFVLPLAGSMFVEVLADAEPDVVEATFELAGRESVFTKVSDFAYVGRDSTLRLHSVAGAEVALPSARCSTRLPPLYGPAEAVPVEVRGAGPASRQVTNLGVPGVWDHAEKLICCEVITPGGNWSSYPPHKHDRSRPCEVVNEEIYYFRVAGPDGVTPSRQGFALHRTYTGPEHKAAGLPAVDETVEVRDGDVYVIPHGYHGPTVAAPGYPLYYLNVMAGPALDRGMSICDDPAHTWERDAWADQPIDPRCPVTDAHGRVQRDAPG